MATVSGTTCERSGIKDKDGSVKGKGVCGKEPGKNYSWLRIELGKTKLVGNSPFESGRERR